MHAHGIRLFTISLLLTSVTFVAAQTPSPPTAGPFEALPHFEASAILPGSLVQGPNHRVAERVNNDGYYNVYRITTPEVGVFDAISTRMLEIRITEINALVTLKKANDAAILATGAVDGLADMFTGAVGTVTNPVETLEAVPGGLNRLFGFAGREVDRAEEKIDANQAAGGQGASTLGMVGQGSESVARGVLGVSAAERRWAEKLKVDPYTTNPVLRNALNRVAELEAAGRLSKDLIPGGAALTAISAASSVNDLGVRPSNHDSRGPRVWVVDNADMAKAFRPYEPDQMLLMPPSLADWVPEDHLARFVRDVVDTLDLTAIEATYTEERGYPPYHPRMMVAVLLYAYATGTYSSRKIARRLVEDVAMRFLAAGNQPDFRTVSDFRKRHSAALASLFTQGLRLCRRAGLVKLGQVAIDGTRLKANASKHKAMSYGRMTEQEAALQVEIAELLRRAEQADRDEDARYGTDRRGDELPAALARRESRLRKIREAKAALEAEAREQAAAQSGKDPAAAAPAPKAQRNFTDPDSKIQKTADGFIQGYNAQAAVDAHAQVIVAQDVTPMAADVGELLPQVTAIGRTLQQRPAQVLADAGYCSEANLHALARRGIDAYIATGRQTHGERLAPAPRGRPPADLTRRERMARKLRTLVGRAVYARRKAIVEPVFGQIKHARRFRQFLRRGWTAVRHEWALVCLVHNLLKLHTAGAWP